MCESRALVSSNFVVSRGTESPHSSGMPTSALLLLLSSVQTQPALNATNTNILLPNHQDGNDGHSMALVFTDQEVKNCVRLRTPSLAVNTHTNAVHIVARCCGKNLCSSRSPGQTLYNDTHKRQLDNNQDAVVVMKTSHDQGKTWAKYQVLSPKGQTSYAGAAVMYDKQRKRLVLQYNYFPRGSTKPAWNVSLWQRYSDDDGNTWSEPRELTQYIKVCEKDLHNTQVQSAGSKVQTTKGRLVWTGHDHKRSLVCVWYSDDGGETYKAVLTEAHSEVSVAVADIHSTELYMNGRGGKNFSPHRAEYRSYDDGATWGEGTKSELMEDGHSSGCERSVINVGNKLFSMEPAKSGRMSMVMQCSTDKGKTWKKKVSVNGNNRGGYSDMADLGDGHILAAWEDGSHPLDDEEELRDLHEEDELKRGPDKDSGNFYAQKVGTNFC